MPNVDALADADADWNIVEGVSRSPHNISFPDRDLSVRKKDRVQ